MTRAWESDEGMEESNRALTVQFLEWLLEHPRSYAETMEAWRTSCPRFPIWEDAVDKGLISVEDADGRSCVRVTAAGLALVGRGVDSATGRLRARCFFVFRPPGPRGQEKLGGDMTFWRVFAWTVLTASIVASAPQSSIPTPTSDCPAPWYPASLRNVDGKIDARISVRADGSVSDVAMVTSNSDSAFAKAAIDALRQWHFRASARPEDATSRVYVTTVFLTPPQGMPLQFAVDSAMAAAHRTRRCRDDPRGQGLDLLSAPVRGLRFHR